MLSSPVVGGVGIFQSHPTHQILCLSPYLTQNEHGSVLHHKERIRVDEQNMDIDRLLLVLRQ